MKILLALVILCVGVDSRSPIKVRCPAPPGNSPVCGNDGKTYSSFNALKCHQMTARKILWVQYNGPCKKSGQPAPSAQSQPVKQAACVCTREFRQVCGSDGKTYSNKCLLDCETKKNPKVVLKHNGACKKPAPTPRKPAAGRVCACPRMLRPVCGSDGKTYSNKCLLNCEAKRNPKLSVKNDGACKNSTQPKAAGKSKPIRNANSPCPRVYRPVCGSDGVTYRTRCALNRRAKTRRGLKMSYRGPCESEECVPCTSSEQEDTCSCPRTFAPVCGSDGTTYPNRCQLECQQWEDPYLYMASRGYCRRTLARRGRALARRRRA